MENYRWPHDKNWAIIRVMFNGTSTKIFKYIEKYKKKIQNEDVFKVAVGVWSKCMDWKFDQRK